MALVNRVQRLERHAGMGGQPAFCLVNETRNEYETRTGSGIPRGASIYEMSVRDIPGFRFETFVVPGERAASLQSELAGLSLAEREARVKALRRDLRISESPIIAFAISIAV